MGAWEVQADPSKPGNKLMRQVSPVWPACWGYACTGPMTYFGPKHFNDTGANGFTITLDVKLEKDAVFSIGGSTGKASFAGVRLDSKNGTYTLGSESGPVSFAAGAFHKVAVTLKAGSMTATLDSKALGAATKHKGLVGGFFVEMSLDRYVFADVDNFMLRV